MQLGRPATPTFSRAPDAASTPVASRDEPVVGPHVRTLALAFALATGAIGRRKHDAEGAAPARLALHLDLATERAHDVVADREPEPGSHAHRLGGEERVEQLRAMLGR